MSSITYYEGLISDSRQKIKKYEQQIAGLKGFQKENDRGAEEFLEITTSRRRNISNSLSPSFRHPMVMKLNTRLSTAIDNSYVNNVLDNFQAVEEEIIRAIRELERRIEDEKNNITYYSRRISEILEEERRAAEARRAEEARRAAELQKAKVK